VELQRSGWRGVFGQIHGYIVGAASREKLCSTAAAIAGDDAQKIGKVQRFTTPIANRV
jgi:hypothetical protein